MNKKYNKPNENFVGILRAIFGKYFKFKYNIEIVCNETNSLESPFLILANHTNFWDPLLVNSYIDRHIHYVASDEYFRNPILKALLKYTGTIPKTKFKSDFSTVKDIIRIKKDNGIIGIFPEGKRNWDGETTNLVFSTAKLIKVLKIPVVTCLLKGAHLSLPRWAKTSRKGKLSISYRVILSPEEIQSLSVEEIFNRISKSLHHDEYEYQKKLMLSFKGHKLAEKLELFLFTCPKCKSIDTMKSNDNLFYCKECGYKVSFNEYGFFDSMKDKLLFETPKEWGQWQTEFIKEYIENTNDISTNILSNKKIILLKGSRLTPLKKFKIGNITLNKKELNFISTLGNALSFDISKIQGLNVQQNNKFEFYHDNILYRFKFEFPNISAYKWVETIQLIKKEKAYEKA